MVLRRQECWRKFLGLNDITPSETLACQPANVTGAYFAHHSLPYGGRVMQQLLQGKCCSDAPRRPLYFDDW